MTTLPPGPATRALPIVLRDALAADPAQVRLLVLTALAEVGNAYVTVERQGVEVTIPKIAGSPVVPDGPAYVAAWGDYMLYLGTCSELDVGGGGEPGPMGPPGPAGEDGTDGTDGATGATGSTGPAGPANSLAIGTTTTGAPGSSAASTITGTPPAQTLNLTIPRGDVGATGTTGTAGTAGAPGSVWRSGAGAPAGALGVVGDWYLNTTDGSVYEKTGASAWTLRDNLTGPTGAPGASGAFTLVSALPGSPTDGQGIYYQSAAMATLGIVWPFRYRSGGGTYKWEAIGATPWWAEVATSDTAPLGASYAAFTTNAGPSITVPLAGDYILGFGGWPTAAGATRGAYISPKIGAASATDADAAGYDIGTSSSGDASVFREMRKTVTAAATIVTLQGRSSGTACTVGSRTLSVQPIRVG